MSMIQREVQVRDETTGMCVWAYNYSTREWGWEEAEIFSPCRDLCIPTDSVLYSDGVDENETIVMTEYGMFAVPRSLMEPV